MFGVIRGRGRRVVASALLMVSLVVSACSAAQRDTDGRSATVSGSQAAPGIGSPAPASVGPLTHARVAAFNSVLRRAVDWSGLAPGVTAAVVSDEGVWQGAYGVGGKNQRLLPTSVMCIASISKTFTAAEVLHLAAQAKIDLDEPLSRYVPNRLTANGATIRQALGMTSGLLDENLPAVARLVEARPNAHLGPQTALDLVPAESISAPGRQWYYSNANYLLLALLIEHVTGRPLAAALRADLFEPTNLNHIAVQDGDRPPRPLAYPFDAKGPVEDGYLPTRAAGSVSAGAGSIATDALTVARWGYQLYGGHVLPPALTQAMITPGRQDSGRIGYGLGTMIFPDFGEHNLAVGHTGGVSLTGPHGGEDGYSTILVTLPALHLSLAVLSPAADVTLDSIIDNLLAAAVG